MLSNMVAAGHMWLFKLIKIKLKIQFFRYTSHISSVQWPHVASIYSIGQSRFIVRFHHIKFYRIATIHTLFNGHIVFQCATTPWVIYLLYLYCWTLWLFSIFSYYKRFTNWWTSLCTYLVDITSYNKFVRNC